MGGSLLTYLFTAVVRGTNALKIYATLCANEAVCCPAWTVCVSCVVVSVALDPMADKRKKEN